MWLLVVDGLAVFGWAASFLGTMVGHVTKSRTGAGSATGRWRALDGADTVPCHPGADPRATRLAAVLPLSVAGRSAGDLLGIFADSITPGANDLVLLESLATGPSLGRLKWGNRVEAARGRG